LKNEKHTTYFFLKNENRYVFCYFTYNLLIMDVFLAIFLLFILVLGSTIIFIFDYKKRHSLENELKRVIEKLKNREDELNIQESYFKEENAKRENIQKAIIKCANDSFLGPNELHAAMQDLVEYLRKLFICEYCAIGKVNEFYIEDYAVTYEKKELENEREKQESEIKYVRKVFKENLVLVSKALKSKALF
jgi:hypothetical protein